MSLFKALIRTHHITSRKKVATLKEAAATCDIFALLRSGGCPGIMYVEGQEDGVREWVDTVRKLRYKDYQLVSRPSSLHPQEVAARSSSSSSFSAGQSFQRHLAHGLHETSTVSDFGAQMQQRGVYAWWRKGMGFDSDSNIK